MSLNFCFKNYWLPYKKIVFTCFNSDFILFQMAATVKNFLNDIDLLSLITKLEDISNLPCHLIKETVVEDQRVR